MYSAFKSVLVIALLSCPGYGTQINSEDDGATVLMPNLMAVAASIVEAPYIVSILHGPVSVGGAFQHIGDGVILTEYIILSSKASTLKLESPVPQIPTYVRAGSNSSSEGGAVRAVNRVVVHPGFQPGDDFTNSAALLVLAKALTFTAAIQPASLPAVNNRVPAGLLLTFYSYNVLVTKTTGMLHSTRLVSIDWTSCQDDFISYLSPEDSACAIAYGSPALMQLRYSYSSPCVYENGTLAGLYMWPVRSLRNAVGISIIEVAAPSISRFIQSNLGLLPVFPISSVAVQTTALSWVAIPDVELVMAKRDVASVEKLNEDCVSLLTFNNSNPWKKVECVHY